MQPDQVSLKNALLSAMSAADFAQLQPNLTHVELPSRHVLVLPGEAIEHCWFLEDGIASMVMATPNGHEVEAGIVGREGFIDVASALGENVSPLRSFMQIAGHG